MAIAPSLDNANGARSEHVLTGKTFWGLTSGQWGLHTGTMPNAPIPKTGQTTSYRTGDDGYYQYGVSWPSPRFTDNEDQTVTDNLTGLMWTKNANMPLNFPNEDYPTDNGRLIWNNAIDYCNALDHAGHSDWRLPNVRELQSLRDYGEDCPPLPDGHPFVSVALSWYWSSSTNAGNTANAWVVPMGSGNVYPSHKSNTYYVWPVRAGH